MSAALRAILPLICAGVIGGAATGASSQLARTAGRAVVMRSVDGTMVSGVFVEATRASAAAVVLVPMLGRPRGDWEGAIERFATANITALAIDLPAATLPQDPKAIEAWHTAVDAAVDYLFVSPDVRGSAIGVVGASLGATLAALAAADDPRVRSLALLSPSLDYRGLPIAGALKAYGDRPALLVASRGDPYAARSVRELAAGPAGLREVLWSDIPAHGTFLLTRQTELNQSLVEWFQRTLG
jgi:pimeloyl-ACP methyl ester carboxylesterase